MKKIFYLNFILLPLFSCNDINDIHNDYNNNKVEIEINVSTENTSTRNWHSGLMNGNVNPGISEDGLLLHKEPENIGESSTSGIIIKQYYNDKLISNTDIPITIPNLNETKQFNNFSLTNTGSKLIIKKTFLKSDNPSLYKFYIYFSYNYGLPNSYPGTPTEETRNIGTIQNVHYNQCLFYGKLKLSETNDWNNINTSVILKRKTSEFIVLTDQDINNISGSKRSANTLIAFNCETQLPYGELGYKTGEAYSYSYQLYDFESDECFAQSFDRINPVFQYLTSSGYNSHYKGGNYRIIGGACTLISESGNLPVISDKVTSTIGHVEPNNGKRLRYLVCYLRTYYDGKDHIYQTSIDLQGMDLKPNKRYIFINRPGTNLFSGTPVTRSIEEISEENINNYSDFEILELDIDEPLPFEINGKGDEI